MEREGISCWNSAPFGFDCTCLSCLHKETLQGCQRAFQQNLPLEGQALLSCSGHKHRDSQFVCWTFLSVYFYFCFHSSNQTTSFLLQCSVQFFLSVEHTQ